MILLHVAAIALNQTAMDWSHNTQNIKAALENAHSKGVQVVCLPELCLTGYGCEDWFLSPDMAAQVDQQLAQLLPETKGMLVAFGLPVYRQEGCYNAVLLVLDGRMLGVVPKQFLAADGLHYEPRWFKPWSRNDVATCSLLGQDLPFGDLLFELGGVRFGIEICRDAWVGDRVGAHHVFRGVDVILNPTASHFGAGKAEKRTALNAFAAKTWKVVHVLANALGADSGTTVFDGDTYIAAGDTVYQAAPLSFAPQVFLSATVSIQPKQAHQKGPWLIHCAHDWRQSMSAVPSAAPLWLTDAHKDDICTTRAIALGMWDYLRKSRARGFVLNLSGGADSAACAVLAQLAIRYAVEALGWSAAQAALPSLADYSSWQAWMKKELVGIYQATSFSSATTEAAAAKVAEALGVGFYRWDIQPLVDAYEQQVTESLNTGLTWASHDLARQNIQARVRAPGAWLLANVQQAILLTTANRSELSMGYATMDGDTAGGLAPLGGVDKPWVLRWLRWMMDEGTPEFGPIPALDVIVQQQPTAELRPVAQTDEADLMPYPLLNAIEQLLVLEHLSPVLAYHALRCEEAWVHFSDSDLVQALHKFYHRWSVNQWKRERSAPAFPVGAYNVSPRSGCRFPILSGNFKQELDALQKLIAH